MGDSEKNVLEATSVMEDSAVNGGAASESIADLLIDRVTFRKYRCPKDECRKTFDEPADLFSHIGTHVSVVLHSVLGDIGLVRNTRFLWLYNFYQLGPNIIIVQKERF